MSSPAVGSGWIDVKKHLLADSSIGFDAGLRPDDLSAKGIEALFKLHVHGSAIRQPGAVDLDQYGATTRTAPPDTLSENECRPKFQVALTTAATGR